MKFLHKLKDGLDVFGKYWSLLIIPLFLMPAIEACVFRYTLNKPTIWTQELSCIIFGIWFMMGGAFGETSGAHVSMDIFYEKYRGWVKLIADILGFLACTALCAVLVWKGITTFISAIEMGQRTESLWAPVVWPNRLAIPVGAFLLWFRTCFTFADKVKGSLEYIRENKKGGTK